MVGRDLGKPNSFLHTASQLIVAACLFQVGNRVGLSLEDNHGRPNPDLYIKMGAGAKLFLEVKAPQALQWGSGGAVAAEAIEAAVKKCVKDSSSQINRSHRGLLIISSSYLSPLCRPVLERAIQNALRARGRDHKYLAAVVAISPEIRASTLNGSLQYDTAFHFSVSLNGHYDGENPVETGSR
jgi:hypothetical protein